MEYVYSALLLHAAKKEINESNVKTVLSAVGVAPDEARVKALVGSLDGVDIAEAVKTAVAAAPAAAAAPAEAKKEEKKEEKGATEEEAMAGLGSLFG